MLRKDKIRIAWFSALEVVQAGQPVFSKSEYATSVLLPLLANNCEVEVFSARAGQRVGTVSSKHFLTAWAQHQVKPFDIFFYNLENGKHCDFARLHLALVPGVSWIHDFTLIDDGPEPILNSPWTSMVQAFNLDLDKAGISWPSKKDQFLPKRPQALREVGMSFATIFSAQRDLEQFQRMNPFRLNSSDRGIYIPLPIDSRNIYIDESIRLAAVLRVATCSSPNVESHLHSLFQAIKTKNNIELTWLIDKSERTKCQELIDEFDLSCVKIVEGRNVEAWSNILKESDLAVHFLYTFYQQSNPWLALSLAQGVFTSVLDFSESEYLPVDAAIRIFPGSTEVTQLCAVFDILLSRQIFRNHAAFSYAKECFDAKAVSEEMYMTLSKLQPQLSELQRKWEVLSQLGRKNLLEQNLISEELGHSKACTDVFSELGWL